MHIVWTVADAARSTKTLAPESHKRCFALLSLTASFPHLRLSAFWPRVSGWIGGGQEAQKVLRCCCGCEGTLLCFSALPPTGGLAVSALPERVLSP